MLPARLTDPNIVNMLPSCEGWMCPASLVGTLPLWLTAVQLFDEPVIRLCGNRGLCGELKTKALWATQRWDADRQAMGDKIWDQLSECPIQPVCAGLTQSATLTQSGCALAEDTFRACVPALVTNHSATCLDSAQSSWGSLMDVEQDGASATVTLTMAVPAAVPSRQP